MKPTLQIQLALVVLSLLLLAVAIMLPTKSREVPTIIRMELGGEQVQLSTGDRAVPTPEPEAPVAPPVTDETTIR